MKSVWVQFGGAVSAAVLALLMSVPVGHADAAATTMVAAEELDKRSKQAGGVPGQSKGMSDSAVRVLMTYAFSTIPEDATGPDGKPMKIDRSDPKVYFIPTGDARRVIRVATRSAYAEVCKLPELGQANFQTMMKGEVARGSWSPQQMQMINTLYLFSVSYFTGNLKLTTKEMADDGTLVEDGAETIISAEAPKCPPAQKQKVINAINAYVQGAKTAPAKP
jgi:hypothetical protein